MWQGTQKRSDVVKKAEVGHGHKAQMPSEYHQSKGREGQSPWNLQRQFSLERFLVRFSLDFCNCEGINLRLFDVVLFALFKRRSRGSLNHPGT